MSVIRPIAALAKSIVLSCVLLYSCLLQAQCPPNIGFEEGSFNKWECYVGLIDTTGGIGVSGSYAIDGRHTMIKRSGSSQLDFYGRFPVTCPNGSGYSIKIGNDQVGAEAEGVSYTFTIPAGQDVFSLIYNYAVVFQDPGHMPHEQPRFTSKVFDVSNGVYISCSSFDYAASGNLPGFSNAEGNVLYKPWSAVTIKLAGYGGKTIRLEFTTNDCTRGGHFGYAYLDIDERCADAIQGNIYCPGTTSMNMTGPYGYKGYRWFDSGFNQLLGTSNMLQLSPAPVAGTKFALEVTPYPGSGCIDTLYTVTRLIAAPFQFSLASSVQTCSPGKIDLTDAKLIVNSSPGLSFRYYHDSTLQDYIYDPAAIGKTGVYYIQASNIYGCTAHKPIRAVINDVPVFQVKSPVKAYWPNTVDITSKSLLTGNAAGLEFSYWNDVLTTSAVMNPKAVNVSGLYYIKAIDTLGCSSIRSLNVVISPAPPPNAFSPNHDGINDVWAIKSLSAYPECTVTIYNRLGQKIFYSFGYSKPWDGTFNGSRLPIGTYYYVIRLSAAKEFLSGSVTLLR